jgi:hypothetical protein
LRKIVVIGNCQAHAIVKRLERAYAAIEDVTVEWVSTYLEITPAHVETIGSAWLVCAQSQDFQNRELEKVNLTGRPVTYFPVMSFHPLWPAATESQPRSTKTDAYPMGIFPSAQYCDKQANAIIRQGLEREAAFQAYLNLDFGHIYKLDRLLDMSWAKLRQLSAKTGFDAIGLYEANFRTQRLHHTSLHPTNFVLDKLTEFLIERIGLPALPWEAWKFDEESINNNQMPIHPDVVKHFGLTWYDDRNKFYRLPPIGWHEYMWRYLTLDLETPAPALMRQPPLLREIVRRKMEAIKQAAPKSKKPLWKRVRKWARTVGILKPLPPAVR